MYSNISNIYLFIIYLAFVNFGDRKKKHVKLLQEGKV